MGVLDQPANAILAAITALAKSADVDIGTVDKACPSMGETTFNVLDDDEETNWPAMKF